MTVTKKTVGTGITKREVTTYSMDDPELGDALHKWAKDLNDALDEGGGFYGAMTLPMVRTAEKILEGVEGYEATMYLEPDSKEWFARRLLEHNKLALSAMKHGDVDNAMRFAFEAGELWATAVMKWQLEPEVLAERKQAKGRRARTDIYNAMRKVESEKNREEWQAEAEKVWDRRPNLSNKAVGEIVAKELGGNPDTIRKKIKHPLK